MKQYNIRTVIKQCEHLVNEFQIVAADSDSDHDDILFGTIMYNSCIGYYHWFLVNKKIPRDII